MSIKKITILMSALTLTLSACEKLGYDSFVDIPDLYYESSVTPTCSEIAISRLVDVFESVDIRIIVYQDNFMIKKLQAIDQSGLIHVTYDKGVSDNNMLIAYYSTRKKTENT